MRSTYAGPLMVTSAYPTNLVHLYTDICVVFTQMLHYEYVLTHSDIHTFFVHDSQDHFSIPLGFFVVCVHLSTC